MTFIVPVEPYPDESLAGLIVRATAMNFRRNPLMALRRLGIVTTRPASLCVRSPTLSKKIAGMVGSCDVETIARKFHVPIEGRAGWSDFFGEPLRDLYREVKKRRVAPGALKSGEYVRAPWSLRPFSFDPVTKEGLIDTCPQCRCPLGWTLTYGIAFCDHCSRPEEFMHWTWHYPGLDLRDFPQPKVEVEDEEALDFVTGLIDPFPGRKEAARRLVPEIWSAVGNGDLFEVAMSLASMLNAERWHFKQTLSRRRRTVSRWEDSITPRMLSVAGRAIIDGQAGFEEFGDILLREGAQKPRETTYGKGNEIGPLGTSDKILCIEARKVIGRMAEAYMVSRKDPDMRTLSQLAKKYGTTRTALTKLAGSRLIPTVIHDHLEKAPVLMSDSALAPLIRQMRSMVSAVSAAPRIGVHRMHLPDLEKRGLLTRVDGPVLKLVKSDAYYTKESLDSLVKKLGGREVEGGNPVRLRVALRALKCRHVPWAELVVAIADGRLKVVSLKASGSLGERLAVADLDALAEVIRSGPDSGQRPASEWVGNSTVAEILGTNEAAVWRLLRLGHLKHHEGAPPYMPFRRAEVERLARNVIFAPEVVRVGSFRTYREASAWLTSKNLAPIVELKEGGWKMYARGAVERLLKEREKPAPPNPASNLRPRPKGVLHGEKSPEGRAAKAQERKDLSRVGHATAASILGCTIFAVQRLAQMGKLRDSRGVTPYSRAELEALRGEIIFLPEMMRLGGWRSRRGVNGWLSRERLQPLFYLKKPAEVPAFCRVSVESRLAKPITIGNAYPREIKRGLLDMVAKGASVHVASKVLSVTYTTAKAWVRESRATSS
ncbi:hypothetical protein ACE10W_05210 [Bradyrhizobium sp. B025]|uniref:hypothetical protein n=1 Tax=Bradyrhizobium sp. B025 TaxID=3344829 RepID=UPI0035D4D01E